MSIALQTTRQGEARAGLFARFAEPGIAALTMPYSLHEIVGPCGHEHPLVDFEALLVTSPSST